MSEQSLDLRSNWERIRKEFRNHFGERDVELDEDLIKYSSGSEHFIIGKEGMVEAGMPLHSFETKDVESVRFEDSEVTVIKDGTSYVFRR